MNYVVDILVLILLLFIILYALKQRTSKYLAVFIIYFLPVVIVFFAASPLYLSLMGSDAFLSSVKNLFASSYLLSGYLMVEIILYILLVILLKIIFSFFKKTSLIADVHSAQKKRLYVNLVLAIVLGYFTACVFVACLHPLGFTNENTVVKEIYKNSILIDLNETNQLNQNIQVYETIVEIVEKLALDVDDPTFLTQVEEYAKGAGRRLQGRVKLFLNATDPTSGNPLQKFVDEKIIKPYEQIIFKKQVIRNALSEKIIEDDYFSEIMVENWVQQYQIDLSNLSELALSKLNQALQKLQLTKEASEKLELYWK